VQGGGLSVGISDDVRLRLAITGGIAISCLMLWLVLEHGKFVYAMLLGLFSTALVLMGRPGRFSLWNLATTHVARQEARSVDRHRSRSDAHV
jgi:hypothetical protein